MLCGDEGTTGINDEFDIYEELQLDAIPTSLSGAKGDEEEGEGGAEATGDGSGSVSVPATTLTTSPLASTTMIPPAPSEKAADPDNDSGTNDCTLQSK